ncbi:MAG: LamG-like jellyroll fold domain-containing protein [Bacteroidota bacterium]
MRTMILMFAILFVGLHGQTGNAVYFQNADYMTHGDFIYCNAPNYGFTNQLTVTAWVKWTVDPSSFATSPSNHENEGEFATYIAYGKHNANDIKSDNLQFSLRNAKTGNKFQFVVHTSGGIIEATSTVGPSVGTWYFLAGVYDGSKVSIYVDGTLTKQVSQSGNINTNADHRLNMGRLPWGYGFFVGYMDEVRIWSRALNATEIGEQMQSVTTVNTSGLKSYWNFNAGSGTVIDDSCATNADGVFYTAAIDVHAFTTTPTVTVSDNDKTWTVNKWSEGILKTVSGAGIDELNTVTSNTSSTLTLQNSFTTTPVLDSKDTPNDTWFGVQLTGETSQWVSSDVPMPVELHDFTARINGRGVELAWRTATEVNNYGFDVERKELSHRLIGSLNQSTDESINHWTKIGFVEGNGTTNAPKSYTFIDGSASGTVAYRLKQIDRDGSFEYSNQVEVTIAAPNEFALMQNHPNPFNPVTSINYTLPVAGHVSLKIYDMLGKEVATLVNGVQDAGAKIASFDASQLPSGIYFYTLRTNNFNATRKMMLVK